MERRDIQHKLQNIKIQNTIYDEIEGDVYFPKMTAHFEKRTYQSLSSLWNVQTAQPHPVSAAGAYL